MKARLRGIVRRIRTHPFSRLIPWAIDRVAASTAKPSESAYSTLIVAATGNGNIGDQAMLDALLEGLKDPSPLIVGEDELSLDGLPAGARTLAIPGLLNGSGILRYRAHRTYAANAKSSDEVIVIGADLMDGLYNPRKSISRYSLLRTAVDVGARARVTGFSWPAQPARVVLSPARSLQKEVKFVLRDPESHRRFTQQVGGGPSSATLAADIVFTDSRRSALPPVIDRWASRAEKEGEAFAVVNISGLIEGRLSQISDYEAAIQKLRSLGLSIIFLPHVFRRQDGDIEVTDRLFTAAGEDSDHLVTELLSPAQVRELTSRARLVITGRMHLAIIALSTGRPAVTLATQGKVSGLYKMFNIPELCVEPRRGFGEVVAGSIMTALETSTHEKIVRALPDVQAIAQENLA